MARWKSPIRTHALAIEAIEAILEDIKQHPGTYHPDLRWLIEQCPIPKPPKKDSEQESFQPAFDLDQLESSEA